MGSGNAYSQSVHVASAGAALTLADVETTPPPRDHVRSSGPPGLILGFADVSESQILRGIQILGQPADGLG
ncbi:MAG: hypothetical protein QOI25_4561 [Mycobacterium sp.]|jgi:hypothetical protein|nr:hypothetical protein [Mycobacterium sp.]